jgi:16S rRNA (uracil1498-N3)-methyltransferase
MVLEKGTELGVGVFIPVMTPRTVVLLNDAERAKNKAQRWMKILQAASKQCGRAEIPRLEHPIQFRDAIKQNQGLTVLAWEGLLGATASESLRLTLRQADQERGENTLRVNLFIGPEGGFSEEEVELAESLGAVVFGLGRSVLRAETAALAAVSLIQYEFSGL